EDADPANYITSFQDNLDSSSTPMADTGIRPVGNKPRAFDFENARRTIVPTGAGQSALGWAIPLLGCGLLTLTAAGLIECRRRTLWTTR
ncbi:MAG: hypothetical protein FWE69_08570, partial [Clostridiales bacterium]|nr:hypothetical protein [Clostridiales bacterium]